MALATYIDRIKRALFVIIFSVRGVLPVQRPSEQFVLLFLLSSTPFLVITACHMRARHTPLPAWPNLGEVGPRKIGSAAEGVEEHAGSRIVPEDCTSAQSSRQRHGASSDLSAPSAPTSS